MKYLSLLLALLFLFQGCYSYKVTNISNPSFVNKPELKIELNNSKIIKGQLKKYDEKHIILEKKRIIKKINIKNIKEIKTKQKSLFKSSILGACISVGVLFILFDNVFIKTTEAALKN